MKKNSWADVWSDLRKIYRSIIRLFNPKYSDPKKDPKNMVGWQTWMITFTRIIILNLIAFCAVMAFVILSESTKPHHTPTEAEKHATVDPE